MGKKTPPWPSHPAWTEARYYAFLRSMVRSATAKWPPAFEAEKRARRPYTGPDKRQKWEYQCAMCGQWFKRTEVEKDHVIPLGSLRSLEDLPGFVERATCSVEGYQMLCKATCHPEKTAKEKEARDGEQ